MSMMLAKVCEDGKYLPLETEYKSVAALRQDMRNRSEAFIMDDEYTLIELKPILKIEQAQKVTLTERGAK